MLGVRVNVIKIESFCFVFYGAVIVAKSFAITSIDEMMINLQLFYKTYKCSWKKSLMEYRWNIFIELN